MFFIFFIFPLISFSAYCQQPAHFSQFRENFLFINPAIPHQEFLFGKYGDDFNHHVRDDSRVSDSYNFTVSLTYREQWSDLKKHKPRTGVLRVEWVPPGLENRVGSKYGRKSSWLFGLAVMGDKTPPISLNSLHGRVGFRWGREKVYLNGGLSFAWNQFRFVADQSLLYDPNDPIGLANETRSFWSGSIGTMAEFQAGENHHFLTGYSINLYPKVISNGAGPSQAYHHLLLGMINNNLARDAIVKSYETLIWMKYLRDIPFEGGASFRFALHPPGKVFIWLGVGSNYSFNQAEFRFHNVFFEPSIVFKGDLQIKAGIAVNIIQNSLIEAFGSTHETNFNLAR